MNHIKILGDISLKSLLKLHIITEVNNHGKATFSGIIAEETGKEILENKIKKVTICYDFAIDNKSYSIVLFAGQIKKCRLKITGRIYNVEVECFSSSIELDKEKKSRSFQNIEMTYGQLFLQMSEEENIILAVKDSNKKIPYPLIQYEETDWKFLKRIAGYLKTMIVPDISQMSPRIAIGTIQGKSYEIFDIDIYQITKNIQYQEKKQNYFYEIKGEINWNLCDKIYYNGEQLMIVKKEIELLNGTLQCKIRAGKENSMAINIYHNNCLCGLHLLGQVIEVDGERLKLNLDIDNKNKGNEMRHSYPYLPITGNGMYAMPEVGSIVRLYFPNDNEKDAFVIDCFSANKNNEAVPDLRRMIIADKNELRLFFSELNIETDSNQIELVDVEELSMSSKGKICINARENILIRNRGVIHFYALENLHLEHIARNDNYIHMEGIEFIIKSEQFKVSDLAGKVEKANQKDVIMMWSAMLIAKQLIYKVIGSIPVKKSDGIGKRIFGGVPVRERAKGDINIYDIIGVKIEED